MFLCITPGPAFALAHSPFLDSVRIMETKIFEIYDFYIKRLVLDLRGKSFAQQLETLTKIRVVPHIFDFCGLTKKLNYAGEVYVVYDYRSCLSELLDTVKLSDVSIFLMDKRLNAHCFGEGEDCACVLCNSDNMRVLIHYL